MAVRIVNGRSLKYERRADHFEDGRCATERRVPSQRSYDPFRRDTSEPKPREEIFVWSFVKDVRTFTGSLRAVDERWEAVYLVDGSLYKTQVFATRVLAEHDLIRTRDALEATGWRPSGVNVEKGGDA
jgi:hypothetical protein